MSLKASISGIRGIVGESLTPDVIVKYVSAYSQMMPAGPILLGRDSRPSGDVLCNFVAYLLNCLGREVIEIGIVPTPTVLFCVKEKGYAGGIVITASHNPIEWNALKLVNSKGKFLSPAEFAKLSELVEQGKFDYAVWDKLGKSEKMHDMALLHLEKVLNFVDVEKIKAKNFKVVIDTVNGAGGPIGAKLLRTLGCEVIEINTETTGYFAHPPEPTPANLTQLSEKMKECGADVGFALDPDADRLVLAGSDGEILSEEYTLALCADHYLSSKEKTDLVINLSSSRLCDDVAAKHGVKVLRVPTGEIHVTESLEQTGAKLGGEGNGGVILPQINKCRDTLVGMALILEYLANNGKKIEDCAKEIGNYSFIKTKFQVTDIDLTKTEALLKEKFPDGKLNNSDGLRLDFDDSWVLIRKSNTEPIVRVFAEAKSEQRALELIESVRNIAGI
ncbi:MAG: phosphoglucosamine mutase [Spirochaetales bacterium]|nr:phosphoglucosamine mutase [Spirochaetales bacterium]